MENDNRGGEGPGSVPMMPTTGVVGQKEPSSDPVCPYCGDDPAQVSSQGLFQLGPMEIVVIYCANQACRKIYSVQSIQFHAAPKIMTPGGQLSRLSH